ncbi:amidase family protein [Streptomyces sp. NPDC056161]|uniref:amidase family protein n=1 Tax=Streptomyces sp. NPDC056161 TaxID=3345732 RepID=UPI0035D8C7D5
MQPYELTLTAAADAIRERQLSPVELADSVLQRITQVEPHLQAYVTVTAERTHRAAREAEHDIANDHYRGPLHGIPMGLKDLIDVAGTATSASSRSGPTTARRPIDQLQPSAHTSQRSRSR